MRRGPTGRRARIRPVQAAATFPLAAMSFNIRGLMRV